MASSIEPLRTGVAFQRQGVLSLCCRLFLYRSGGLGANGADRLVHDDVEELGVVGPGFLLDHLAHALAGSAESWTM